VLPGGKTKAGIPVNAQFLRRRMKEVGTTVEQLAPRVRLTKTTFERVTYGYSTHPAVIALVAQHLQCEETELLMLTDAEKEEWRKKWPPLR
jgi:hypothetical protein